MMIKNSNLKAKLEELLKRRYIFKGDEIAQEIIELLKKEGFIKRSEEEIERAKKVEKIPF